MSNISVGKRFWVAVLIPLTMALVLAVWALVDLERNREAMSRVVESSEYVGKIGALMHALQVERGTTAGFIGSKGQQMAVQMKTARAGFDEQLKSINALTEGLALLGQDNVNQQWASIRDRLTKIGETRSSIDALGMPGTQTFAYYTGIISNMLALNETMAVEASEGTVAFRLLSIVELMKAGELAGQERGMGAGIIASGAYEPGQFDTLAKFGGAQSSYLKTYVELQSHEIAQAAETVLKSDDVVAFENMRSALIRQGETETINGMDAGQWFSAATKRMGQIASLLEASLADIASSADGKATDTARGFFILGGAVLAGLLISIFIPTSLAFTVLRPLKRLTRAMQDLVEDKCDINSIPSLGRDEIGAMADSVRAFVRKTEERIEREREAEMRLAAEKADEEDAQSAERARVAHEQERAIDALSAVLDDLAVGNFEVRIGNEMPESFQLMADRFNGATEMMRGTMAEVRVTSRFVTGSANTLAENAEELSVRTEEQQRSLENSSGALRSLTESIVSTAQNAQRAMQSAIDSKSQAERSGGVVRNAVDAMGAINESSEQIGQIIGVIDDIAFQTNLLALNAGVEAARAGEAGKGFAVVAQEVRELAQRCAEAAQEIKSLISASSDQVKSGVSLVEQSGEALAAIIGQINETSSIVELIANNTTEQSGQLSEVNNAIQEIEQLTQKNTEMVIGNSHEIHELSEKVRQLNDKLATFRTRSEKPATDYRGPERRGLKAYLEERQTKVA